MSNETSKVAGQQRLKKQIGLITAKYNLPSLVPQIGDLLLKRVKNRFDREVNENSQPWAPLKPATIERKKKLGYGSAKKLVREGDLRNAIAILRSGDLEGTTFFNTGAGLRIGIEDPEIAKYGRIQNQGSKNNKRIVARRFLGIGNLDVRAVDSFMVRTAAKLTKDLNNA